MKTNFVMVDEKVWCNRTQYIEAIEIVKHLTEQVKSGLVNYSILPDGPEKFIGERCLGFNRVSVKIPVSDTLYDQFFNGRSGYRAQYYVGIEYGEYFNRFLIDKIASLIVSAEELYIDKFTREFCEQSLCGKYSKFWFSKEITDQSYQKCLSKLPEVILPDRWSQHWKNKPKPRKGLLAPDPENKVILLNGTFVDKITGNECEQKPERSKEIHKTGWT